MSLPVLVQVVQELTPGGIQVMVLELARELSAEFDVHVVSLEGTRAGLAARWARAAAVGARLHGLNKPPGSSAATVVRLFRLIHRLRPVAVHTHHLGPLLYGGLAARLAGVRRLVHTEHDAWHLAAPRHRDLQKVALAMLRPRLVADARQVAAELQRVIPGSRPRIIPNGIDVHRFSLGDRAQARAALRLPSDAALIGTAGRLEPVKGQATLIRAFARLPADTLLAIAGEGSLCGDLQALAAALGVADRVRFLGGVDDMPSFYRALNVFCLPSQAEGLPLTLLEAQACGIAVVATDVGGVSEVLAPEAAAAVAAGDEESLARALIDALRRAHPTPALREFVVHRYDIAQMTRAYRELLLA